MHYKFRTKSEELLTLEYLNKRMTLPEQERNYYLYLKKGYEGEVLFDLLTEDLPSELLVLNDLLLKNNKTIFQIDILIISSNKVYIFEVKNFEGDYYYESDKIFKLPKTEITNPLNQLRRSETLLKQLILSLGYNLTVEGKVVFINPEFTLYQSPLNSPFLFPTQIKRYLRQLASSTTKLTDWHRKFAEKLVSLHNMKSVFTNIPAYEYDQLRKGITCNICDSFSIAVSGKNCICDDCGHTEFLSLAVMRSVKEFKILFPKEKITTNSIHEWCKVVDSRKRIRRILNKNFNIVGVHQWAYYE